MSVEFYRGSPGKFDSRTLNGKTLTRWTGRISVSISIHIHTSVSIDTTAVDIDIDMNIHINISIHTTTTTTTTTTIDIHIIISIHTTIFFFLLFFPAMKLLSAGLWTRPAARYTPNLPTNIMDFRGFDSSIILILRGGVLMSIGDFPESLSQAMLVGIMLVGRLSVQS